MNPEFWQARQALLAAQSVDEAADLLLGALLAQCRTLLRQGPWARSARLLRGMVHLRPQEGYRGLYIKELGTDAPPDAVDEVLPSATVWRWVDATRAPVEVDVTEGRVRVPGGGELAQLSAARSESGDAFASRAAILRRAATHILALPMLLPGGRSAGMVSLEVSCPPAIGSEGLALGDIDALTLLVDLGAAALVDLPMAASEIQTGDPLLPVVGRSMARLVRTLRVFASQPETLLILGPTGVGKSRMARWCHQRSGRGGEFVAVDLLTLSEDMQMPELFGWRKGAFTGAQGDYEGAVFRAAGGTLFLDEIDKLSLKAQAGLLTLLESRQAKRLGDPKSVTVDVRILVGSNADLKKLVELGSFREDLYYRVNVLPVRLPSLDERRDEIASWAEFMVQRRHKEGGGTGKATLSGDASLFLASMSWPGNLRQLDNVLRRSYALTLVEMEGPDDYVLVGQAQVARALEMESGQATKAHKAASGLLDAISAAGEQFADRAQSTQGLAPVELDDLESLRGAALESLLARVGEPAEVFRLMGLEALVEGRNYTRVLRRDLARWEALREKLGAKKDAS